MRKIIEIQDVQEWASGGQLHHKTYAVVQKTDDPLDVEEVVGYGNDYDLGELVEVFYDDKWHTAKMQKRS